MLAHGPYTIGKSHLTRESWIYITCYFSEGITAVCRSVWFERIVNAVYSSYTVRKMHLIKHFKRQNISIQGWCHNKQACRYAYIPRFLNVNDNMVRLKRKKISIKGFCHNKPTSYRWIHCSLSMSDKMTRLKRNKLSFEGYCQNKQARYTFIPRSLSMSDNMAGSKRNKISIQRWCHNKQACRYGYKTRSLNVSDNMVCLKPKKYKLRDFATTNKPVIDVHIPLSQHNVTFTLTPYWHTLM